MSPRTLISGRALVAALAIGTVLLATIPLMAQESSAASDRLADAIAFYTQLKFDKGLAVTDELLQSGTLDSKDSIAVYAVMSMLTYAKGEDFISKSFAYLDQMADIGPCKIQLPYNFWPRQLRDRWYAIAKAKNALVCPEDAGSEIKTVAIMEFDNYSVGEYQEELGFITKGLAEFFEADFAKISDLKVVERDKIDFILKEIEMSQEGMVSPSTAVQVGKLLGAQLMIFGSITQLDSKNTKMLTKVVKVETSEIIATVESEGKPDYFKMEKEMVKELAAKLDLTLNEQTIGMLDEGGTESADAAGLYSRGLYYMDQYDYKQAYQYFKLAYEKDNSFIEAKRKMDIYRPLAS